MVFSTTTAIRLLLRAAERLSGVPRLKSARSAAPRLQHNPYGAVDEHRSKLKRGMRVGFGIANRKQGAVQPEHLERVTD